MALPYIIGNPYLDANLAYLAGGANIAVGTISTSNASATTVATVAIPTNTTVLFLLMITARRTGGSAGTTGDAAGYVLAGSAKNIAGTVTIVGQSLLFTAEDQAAWTAALAVSSTNILVQVTGAANNNIDWSVSGRTLGVA